MLFSATQTTKVQDLARISLRPGPLYIDVHGTESTSTVSTLSQGYVVCPSDRRFLLLFTFLKKNLKKKVVVFFSSCNSVKYHAELLNYIDVPVLDLHVRTPGTMLSKVTLTILSRGSKNSRSAQIRFLSSATRSQASFFARTWQLAVLISLAWTGSYSSTRLTILVIIFTELAEPRALERLERACYSFWRANLGF